MTESEEMLHLCQRVREYLGKQDYKTCREEISYVMYLQPDSPEPHNLMGILMEKQRDHKKAMQHFRAAYALDPSYLPARENLMEYAQMSHKIVCRYTYADCK